MAQTVTVGERQGAILFADVSGFTRLQGAELKAFVENFLTPFARDVGDEPRVANTWGDAIFLIFNTPLQAAECAIKLRDTIRHTIWPDKGIHKELRIRIALHNASAAFMEDPITRRQNAYGPHINMAARLEPVTLPNEVFMTEQFKVALAGYQTSAYAWDDVGMLALAKDWGDSQVYRLRRPTEQEKSREQLLFKSGTSSKEPMPNANALLASTSDTAEEAKRLLEFLDDYLFGTGIIRQNWTIDATYDLSKLRTDGNIIEHLEWSYYLLNNGSKEIDYDLSLISDRDLEGEGGLISFHLIRESGAEIKLPWAPGETAEGAFNTRNQVISLEPKQKYKLELRYLNKWPVNVERPLIHNSFMPRETSYHNRLTINAADAERVGVIFRVEEIKPQPTHLRGRYIFNLPSPMLRHQGVEVVLSFKPR